MDFRTLIKTYYSSILIFFCLLAFTLFAYSTVETSAKARRERLFEQRVQRVTETIKNRVSDYTQILKGCQSLFYASDSVTYENWKTYIENLNLNVNYPGIQAVAYAAWVPKEEVRLLEAKLRERLNANFTVKSDFQQTHLAPIIYIEPFTGRNLRAFGYDMYSEVKRREAMHRAMTTGQPALTRRVTLVQETHEDVQPGFLLYLPVYANQKSVKTAEDRVRNLRGFVYNPFRARDLMGSVLSNFKDIQVEIYDGNHFAEENLLYASGPNLYAIEEKRRANVEFTSDTTIYTAGTQWRVFASSSETFGSSIERDQPVLVLIVGLAITSLMVIISVNFVRNRKRVLHELMLSREIEKKKDEFIGIASHELKTPLTSIKAYIQLLDRADLRESDRIFVRKANVQIKKLNNLISDLLNVSKIQAGKLQFNIGSFSVKDLVEDSVESVQHLYSSHKIILTSAPLESTVEGDKFRLEQALTNLLVNAIKYSPGNYNVYVSTRIEKGCVVIEVKDEGIGISERSQRHIFEKFYRAEGLSPALSGLGMGLYISNEIIRRHHGKIVVKSAPEKGSVFSIYLPLSSPNPSGGA
ncbi:CHASE domain-containing protein [Pedobacter sp. SYSU D00535]|uniref:CHASE domain-containing sensor histidine kinase n=1 Tax=Pedobacter sp. SYSU D00535 TaxID=2810308 RepID=UPI001A96BBC0|nr:CHASE domain-containing protein [Pedobacter sp. SYSU D00535]